MKDVLLSALRRDPELFETLKDSVRGRIDGEGGRISTVLQAAEALEPVLEDVVRKRPSRLGLLGLKSAHLLADLATDDDASNGRLAQLASAGIVGIVFADVAGFTEFTSEHGDRAAIDLLTRVDEQVSGAVAVGQGETVKRFGDGFLLAFPSASQAVRAAVELSERVTARRAENYGAMVRVAAHAGEPLIESDDLLGHDVNLTARLLDECEPGEVVVSDEARELAERRVRTIVFERRREVKVRGLVVKVVVWTARRRRGAVP